MANTTLLIGALLIFVGVSSYAVTGGSSFTALIPAILGLIFVVLGVVARREAARRHAMHAAAAVALLGALGSLRGLPDFARLLSGGEVERPVAALAQGGTVLLCLTLVVLAVRSFVAARRARTQPS